MNAPQTQQPAANPFALQKQGSSEREVEFIPFGTNEKIRLSVKMIQTMLAVPTKSKATCSERDAMKFLMLCKSKGLNPWDGDAFLIGYDSQDGPTYSLITAHQAFLKRAELHPEYDGMESGVIISPALACPMCQAQGGREVSGNWVVCTSCKGIGQTDEIEGDMVPQDHTLMGGWARIHFKNRKIPMKRRIALRTFNKGFGRWKDDAAGMIVKCAEADGLRSSFPTKLGGLYMREEQDIPANAAVRATDLGTIVDADPAPVQEAQVQQPERRTRKATVKPEPAQTQAANSDQGDEVPMDYPSEPAEPAKPAKPALPPREALAAMLTASGFSNEQLMEVLIRRYKAPMVKSPAEFTDEYVLEVIRQWDLVVAQMKFDRNNA